MKKHSATRIRAQTWKPRSISADTAERALLARCLFAALLLHAGAATAAERFGSWVPLTGLDPGARLHAVHLRQSRCRPLAEEVALPAYPGAVIVALDWGRVRPACEQRDGWTDLGSVTLLSTDPPTTVAAWYRDTLAGYERYPAPVGELFINATITAYLWDRDYYKYPNIAVAEAPALWRDNGYLTQIELNRPSPAATPLLRSPP